MTIRRVTAVAVLAVLLSAGSARAFLYWSGTAAPVNNFTNFASTNGNYINETTATSWPSTYGGYLND
jgi:hypothetical protein